jgi:hypothetical protein
MQASEPVKSPEVWERHYTLLIRNVRQHVGLMCAAHFPPLPKRNMYCVYHTDCSCYAPSK